MLRLQDGTTRSDAGPILGALGALGLTVAFVALRRSKPRQRDQDGDKRRALATYLRDHLAGADTAIQTVQGLSDADRGGPEGALFESLYEQFREDRGVVEGILAELGYTSRSVKRLAGRATGSALRVVAGCAPGECISDARGARHRRAGQAMPLARRTGACRASAPARSSELRRTGSGCGPSVGGHRAASPLADAAHVRRLTPRSAEWPRRTTEPQSTSKRGPCGVVS